MAAPAVEAASEPTAPLAPSKFARPRLCLVRNQSASSWLSCCSVCRERGERGELTREIAWHSPMPQCWLVCLLAAPAAVAAYSTPLGTRRVSSFPLRAALAPTMAEEEVALLVSKGTIEAQLLEVLSAAKATREEAEAAFAAALAVAYAPPPPPPPPPSLDLVEPANPSDAQRAFREYFEGRLTTSATQKFLSALIEDRATTFRFQYSRVYALGFIALCDAFLPASCRFADDAAATRSALCFSLGLDEATVAADAAALSAAARSMSKEELLATDDLQRICAASPRFKYTYTFGVGLVLLMKAAGEAELAAPGLGYGAKYAGASQSPGRPVRSLTPSQPSSRGIRLACTAPAPAPGTP